MNKTQLLQATLQRYGGRKLDTSDRGSGLNAVWLIRRDRRRVVLKTFSRRRARIRTVLLDVGHGLTGRTRYNAWARYRTEAENLSIWRREGFDVPELLPPLPASEMPLPHLCMAYVSGVLLSDFMTDPDVSPKQKETVLVRFLHAWGARHARAEALAEPRLIQEHGTVNHVFVSGDQLVTFDLEISYTGTRRLRSLIGAEIIGYLRSLLKGHTPEAAQRILDLLVREYPHREYLEAACTELFQNPNPGRRLFHALDRCLLRRPDKMHKFRAAEILAEAMRRNPT